MKLREKNPELKTLIEYLHKKSFELDAKIWKAVAKNLNKPTRSGHKVNLYRIQKHVKSKETILVPGVVLGSGEIKKPVNVAALKFSKNAKEKIEKAGGKCMSIQELFEKNKKGKGVRIIG